MKNVKIWFYDNTKIGSDGYVSFTKSIDQKLGMKQVAAITDKFDNASSNKEMFKVLNAKLRSSKKHPLTEKQIENLMNPVKKFFNARDLVITHLEVVDVKGKKFVSAVASRVKRDSLGVVAKILDRRVFWFGCRFEIHALTRDVKITCSTSAGVNPYFAILSEENHHDHGTSFRAGMIKRIESDNVINESDRKKPVSEKRKEQMKAAKETFKAKKAAAKATVKVMEDLKETATEIENELANFEMPEVVEVEATPAKEEDYFVTAVKNKDYPSLWLLLNNKRDPADVQEWNKYLMTRKGTSVNYYDLMSTKVYDAFANTFIIREAA
ncbi:hypothetical protein ACE1EC_004402 [Salmonella enterica]|nr:hypothetical protein [Salmonella enterica]EEE0902363.1 hypothetical protein [Salmonella enterica subsp. enterica serovar Saintpaul]